MINVTFWDAQVHMITRTGFKRNLSTASVAFVYWNTKNYHQFNKKTNGKTAVTVRLIKGKQTVRLIKVQQILEEKH